MIDIALANTNNLAKTITDKQNKYQELANKMCAMWKQNAAQLIPIVISSTVVIPKSQSQSLTDLTGTPIHIYTIAKICNSWHMLNCQKLFELQVRLPSLIFRSEKFDNKNNNNNNNNNKEPTNTK